MFVIIGDISSTPTSVLELSWLARVSLEGSMLKSSLHTTHLFLKSRAPIGNFYKNLKVDGKSRMSSKVKTSCQDVKLYRTTIRFCVAYKKCKATLWCHLIYLFIYLSTRVEGLSRDLVSNYSSGQEKNLVISSGLGKERDCSQSIRTYGLGR